MSATQNSPPNVSASWVPLISDRKARKTAAATLAASRSGSE